MTEKLNDLIISGLLLNGRRNLIFVKATNKTKAKFVCYDTCLFSQIEI